MGMDIQLDAAEATVMAWTAVSVGWEKVMLATGGAAWVGGYMDECVWASECAGG